jgi:hypothetical protein
VITKYYKLAIILPLPLFHSPYTLPSSVSRNPFVCHSYEKCRGVYQQFPFWFFTPAPTTRLATRHYSLATTQETERDSRERA